MIKISFSTRRGMTGGGLPAFMASSPTEILRQWRGEVYSVLVSSEDIAAASAEIAASGMEAPSGGETGTGSTEGDSQTAESGDAQ